MTEQDMGNCMEKQSKTSPKQKETMKKHYKNSKERNNSIFVKAFAEKLQTQGITVDFSKIPLTYSDNKYKLLVMKKLSASLGVLVLDNTELTELGETIIQ